MRLMSFILAFLLVGSAVALPEIIGSLQTDYDPMTMYLSELGADGAPHASFVNSVGFLATGILTVLLLGLARQRLPRHALISAGLVCCLGVAIGYLGAFAFPCEPGCPIGGGARQALHNIAGLVEYAGAIAGLGLIALALLRIGAPRMLAATLVALALVAGGFAMMMVGGTGSPVGFWQRVADYGFFAWLIMIVAAPNRLFRHGGSLG